MRKKKKERRKYQKKQNVLKRSLMILKADEKKYGVREAYERHRSSGFKVLQGA